MAQRLTTPHHDHHDLLVSSLQVPLDRQHRLETLVLRGSAVAVRHFDDRLCTERGVRHGKVNLISVELPQRHRHEHDADAGKSDAPTPHLHLRPAH